MNEIICIDAQFSQDELIQLDDEYFDLLAHEFGLPFESNEHEPSQQL